MIETPFSLSLGGETVRGALHLPEAASPAPAVLWLADFAGDRVGARRLFVDGARRLARAGVASLRFDYRGCGESDGAPEQTTFSGQLEDARAALAALRSHPGVDPSRIALVGHSMGAAVAAALAGEPGPIALALWSPVVFPVPIFARLGLYAAHPELQRQGHIDFNGLPVGRGFMRELAAIDPLSALAGWRQPTLVAYGGQDTLVSSENAEAILAELPHAEGACRPQAGHGFAALADREWLLDTTTGWLERTLGVGTPLERV